MATLLHGAPVAARIYEEVRQAAAPLFARGIVPCLAIVRVGARAGDVYYENSAAKRATSLGIGTKRFPLAADATQEALLGVLDKINKDPTIHGCLLLRPLPVQFSDEAVRNALCPEKDVDGITDASLAAVFTGTKCGFAPCTAEACLRMLNFYDLPISGKRAVVIGRSLVVGKPVSMLLLAQDATVTLCHSKTPNLPAICREAEILVAAAGKRALLGAAHIAPGQVVLDVGIHTDENGALCGDVDAGAANAVAAAFTPVPGGLGAITTALLMQHTAVAARLLEG